VLVGTTASNYGVAGSQLGVGGNNYMTRSGANPLLLNRLSSDGAILSLMKDGTAVGSIGTQGGDLNIGTGACGIAFVDGVPALYPWTTSGNATRDAAIDLGDSGARFKDLYLSGTMLGNITKLRQHTSSMYVSPTNTNTLNGNLDADSDTGDMWINYRGYQDGFSRYRDFRIGDGKGNALVLVDGSAGTMNLTNGLTFGSGSGAAHTLDDYEEGTWTPVIDGSSGGAYTMGGLNAGRYTKIGNTVHCTASIEWTGRTTAYSGYLLFTGFPFACGDVRCVGTIAAINSGLTASSTSYDNFFSVNIDPNNAFAYVIENGASTYSHQPTVAATGKIYTVTMTYRTA